MYCKGAEASRHLGSRYARRKPFLFLYETYRLEAQHVRQLVSHQIRHRDRDLRAMYASRSAGAWEGRISPWRNHLMTTEVSRTSSCDWAINAPPASGADPRHCPHHCRARLGRAHPARQSPPRHGDRCQDVPRHAGPQCTGASLRIVVRFGCGVPLWRCGPLYASFAVSAMTGNREGFACRSRKVSRTHLTALLL